MAPYIEEMKSKKGFPRKISLTSNLNNLDERLGSTKKILQEAADQIRNEYTEKFKDIFDENCESANKIKETVISVEKIFTGKLKRFKRMPIYMENYNKANIEYIKECKELLEEGESNIETLESLIRTYSSDGKPANI